jgi:chromosome segregation ATPase
MMTNEDAETIAAEALNFIASDAARLVRFLDLSGLDPSSVRTAARSAGFLAGVLDYICGDEALLVAFAEKSSLDPSAVAQARKSLSGRWERDVP